MSDRTLQNVAQARAAETKSTETTSKNNKPKNSSIYEGLQTVFGFKATKDTPAETETTQTQQPLPETLEGHIDDIQETLGLDQNTDSDFINRLRSYSSAARNAQQTIIAEIEKRFYQHAQAYQELQKTLTDIEALEDKLENNKETGIEALTEKLENNKEAEIEALRENTAPLPVEIKEELQTAIQTYDAQIAIFEDHQSETKKTIKEIENKGTGVTQEDLKKLTDIDQSTLTQLKRNSDISIGTASYTLKTTFDPCGWLRDLFSPPLARLKQSITERAATIKNSIYQSFKNTLTKIKDRLASYINEKYSGIRELLNNSSENIAVACQSFMGRISAPSPSLSYN